MKRHPKRPQKWRSVLAVACALAALGGSACSKESSDTEKRLRAALDRTERLAHRFSYTETFKQEKATRETLVQGLVEDDFRYKARLSVGPAPVLDEAVSDDALAVRFLEPALLKDFARRPDKKNRGGTGLGADVPYTAAIPAAPTPVAADDAGPDPVEALRSRRWVLDKAGAPASFGGPETERSLGRDPILDALDVFSYVERAIDEAVRIVEFNEESLEYRKSEDPFPRPKKDSGVIRYDFIRPGLPKASDRAPGGNQITPDTRHFRKMSVYVKGGRVVQILEDVDVESRLKDLSKVYDTNFPKGLPDSQVAAIAIDVLNVIRTGQGDDPIRLRTMAYKAKDLGDDVKVDMPTEVVETSLAVLQNRGKAADQAAGAALAAGIIGPPAADPAAPAAPAPSG